MNTNFQFLKKINNNLFEIIVEAEKLYKDEYFEQSMVQTRRFAEQICKEILKENKQEVKSFDEMLTILKENSTGSIQEKEFIDDLYFLKKNGNQSAHSGSIKKDGINALECLKRAFEISINYCVYNKGASEKILKLNYDIDTLMLNKKPQKSLANKYKEEKEKEKEKEREREKEKEKIKIEKKKKEKSKENIKQIKLSFFWKFIIFLSSISLILILFLIIIVNIKN